MRAPPLLRSQFRSCFCSFPTKKIKQVSRALRVYSHDLYGLLLTGSNTGLIGCGIGIAIFLFVQSYVENGCACRRSLPLHSTCRDYTVARLSAGRFSEKRVLTAVDTGDISQAGTFGRRFESHYRRRPVKRAPRLFSGLERISTRVSSAVQKPVHNIYLLLWTEGGIHRGPWLCRHGDQPLGAGACG